MSGGSASARSGGQLRGQADQVRELLAQPGGQLGRAQPGGRGLGQALGDDPGQALGQAGDGRHLLGDVPSEHRAGVAAAERGEAGEQLVEHGGQGVDVDRGARLQALDDLGGEVVGGADDPGGPGAPGGVHQAGDAEVGELGARGAAGAGRGGQVQQHVLRLDVAVDDPGGVRGGQAVGHVGDHRDGDGRGQRALALQPGAQVGALDQLHHQGEVVAVHHHVADLDHVGVVEAGQRGALLDEAADQHLIGCQVLAQQLDCHRSVRALTEPHGPGGPPADHLLDGVPAADLACQCCCSVGGGSALPFCALGRSVLQPPNLRARGPFGGTPIGPEQPSGGRKNRELSTSRHHGLRADGPAANCSSGC
ncbi:hypothetical protein GCM10020229_15370 [Kitasatospora albolonga]